MSDYAWPTLTWTVTGQKLSWLVDRTQELAQRARAFELALEEAAANGEAPLSRASEPLAEWEHQAANVWMYAGLEHAQKVSPEDIGVHVEELQKIHGALLRLRAEILKALGPAAAARVQQLEQTVKVDDAQIQLRVGELPSFQQTDALGNVTQLVFSEPPEAPISADELKSRMANEQKSLPEGADFKTLLQLLPPPWVTAVFDTYGLLMPESDGDDEVELTANSRSTIQRRLLAERMGEELLRNAVMALADEDRQLLSEMIDAGGAIRYADARNKYGKDDADGFLWPERPPSGTVARLRRVGLGFVGMRGGKQVLALPSDLLPVLKGLLAAPE